MLYMIFAKTKLQHWGETFGEYPSFYYFSRTLLFIYDNLSACQRFGFTLSGERRPDLRIRFSSRRQQRDSMISIINYSNISLLLT
jgi:hypothetical protein